VISGLPPLKCIARYEYAADGGAYTFSGILALIATLPFAARHIVLTVNGQSDQANNDSTFTVQVNADAGNNYNMERLRGVGAAATCARSDNQTAWNFAVPGDATANNFGGGQILIVDAFGGRADNNCLGLCGSTEQRVQASVQRRNNTAAVDSLTVLGNTGFKAGTILELAVVDERYLVAGGEQILLADGMFAAVDNLPQVPGDLSIIANVRTSAAAVVDYLDIALNGDAVAANYPRQALYGLDAGPPGGAWGNSRNIALAVGNNATADVFAPACIGISQGALPDNYPHVVAISGYHNFVAIRAWAHEVSMYRTNSEAVHTVELSPNTGPNLLAGSYMGVYKTPKRLLERVVLDAPAASILFDNGGAGLSQNYRDLGFSASCRSVDAVAGRNGKLRFNGDAVDANYNLQFLQGAGGAAASGNSNTAIITRIPGANQPANVYGGGTILIPAYAESDRHKHRLSASGRPDQMALVESSRWGNPAPVTSIEYLADAGNLAAGSVFELWGICRIDDNIWAEIGGVEVAKQKGSLNIRNAIQERATCSFTVIDQAGTATYQKGQRVEVLQHCHPLFSGIIDSVTRTKLNETTTVHHAIRAVGYEALLDKRRAAATYVAQTAEQIVRDLAANYMNEEGIWLGTVHSGPTVPEVTINYARLSDAMEALAETANFVWGVDVLQRLYFQEANTVPGAPASTSMIEKRSPKIVEKAPLYRNRQYVRGGKAQTALQVENFTGDGATVAFAVGYPIHTTPTVTVGGAPQTVGIKGIEVGQQVYWNKGDPIVTFAAAPAGAAAIVVSYIGQYEPLIVADEPGEIEARAAIEAGTGIWEEIDDEAGLTDLDTIRDAAIAKLDRYGVVGEVLTFATVTPGYEPGQRFENTWPSGSKYMLVESVVIDEVRADKPHFKVTAISGPSLGDWTKWFRKVATQEGRIMDRLTIGADTLVIVVVRESGNWEWAETNTFSPFACETPDAVGPPFCDVGPPYVC